MTSLSVGEKGYCGYRRIDWPSVTINSNSKVPPGLQSLSGIFCSRSSMPPIDLKPLWITFV